MDIDRELLALLACPACRGELTQVGEALHCRACRLAYPIHDGVPDLLAESASPLEGGGEEASR